MGELSASRVGEDDPTAPSPGVPSPASQDGARLPRALQQTWGGAGAGPVLGEPPCLPPPGPRVRCGRQPVFGGLLGSRSWVQARGWWFVSSLPGAAGSQAAAICCCQGTGNPSPPNKGLSARLMLQLHLCCCPGAATPGQGAAREGRMLPRASTPHPPHARAASRGLQNGIKTRVLGTDTSMSLAEPSGCATAPGMGWELLLGYNCRVSEAHVPGLAG